MDTREQRLLSNATYPDSQARHAQKVGMGIKKLREQLGISQYDFVQCKNSSGYICSVKTLGRIEQGKTNISYYVLCVLLSMHGQNMVEFERIINSSHEPYDATGK